MAEESKIKIKINSKHYSFTQQFRVPCPRHSVSTVNIVPINNSVHQHRQRHRTAAVKMASTQRSAIVHHHCRQQRHLVIGSVHHPWTLIHRCHVRNIVELKASAILMSLQPHPFSIFFLHFFIFKLGLFTTFYDKF